MKNLALTVLLFCAPLSWGKDIWYCTQNHTALASPNDIFDMALNQRFTVVVDRGEGSLNVGEPFNLALDCITTNCNDKHGGGNFVAALSHDSKNMSWTNYFGLNIEAGSFQTFFEHSKAAGMTGGTCETF